MEYGVYEYENLLIMIPKDEYRERMAADDAFDSLRTLQNIRFDIENDIDLDDADRAALLRTLRRLIDKLLVRRLDE